MTWADVARAADPAYEYDRLSEHLDARLEDLRQARERIAELEAEKTRVVAELRARFLQLCDSPDATKRAEARAYRRAASLVGGAL